VQCHSNERLRDNAVGSGKHTGATRGPPLERRKLVGPERRLSLDTSAQTKGRLLGVMELRSALFMMAHSITLAAGIA